MQVLGKLHQGRTAPENMGTTDRHAKNTMKKKKNGDSTIGRRILDVRYPLKVHALKFWILKVCTGQTSSNSGIHPRIRNCTIAKLLVHVAYLSIVTSTNLM